METVVNILVGKVTSDLLVYRARQIVKVDNDKLYVMESERQTILA